MRTIAFYRPGRTFPAISVTGRECALMCDHCQGRYLQGMLPARSPEALLDIADRMKNQGAEGFLLSGGCDKDGKVPLWPFLTAVRHIKSTTNLKINLHPGLPCRAEAEEIARTGADRISFDLVLDRNVIRDVMHLDRTPEDVINSFRSLCRAAPGKVAPHVLLGPGDPKAELKAIQTAGEEDVPCLILLSLLGEKVENWEGRLLRAVDVAVGTGRPVVLGCMRPRGRPDVEMAALEAGASGMACPSSTIVNKVEERGWKGVWHRGCCALHR
ncbi:MAG: radical SAM protein [Methanomassiliicoccus sp.]|nr:MAG: radical SAM protein [Methanomassiliicoccus sp.]